MLDPLFNGVHPRELYKRRNLSDQKGLSLCTVPMNVIAKQNCHLFSTGKLMLDPIFNGVLPQKLSKISKLSNWIGFLFCIVPVNVIRECDSKFKQN